MDFEKKTILIIDESLDIQQGVQTCLSDRPCNFVFLDKPEDAVVSLMVEAPDFLIFTMEIGGGDGVALLGNIRTMNPDIPLVILIGKPSKEKVIAAKQARALDILLKPPDWERLASKVKNSLWMNPDLLANTVPAASGETQPDGAPAEGAATPAAKPDEPAPFVEAIPKGAEVLNINDTIAGMKVARTLVFNNVVYGDKGRILTDQMIKQFSRMGIAEICVYINTELKRQVEERKKRALQQKAIVAPAATATAPGQVTAKVGRQALRVSTDIIGTFVMKNADGEDVEHKCNVVDVSAGGCAMLSADKIPKDQTIFLTFDLDGIVMSGIRSIVRHCMARNAKPPEYPMRCGIFFDSITERDRERLFNKIFQLERANKQKEEQLRERFGYGPKKRRPPK
jgi:CheY-like chemotaxis protein